MHQVECVCPVGDLDISEMTCTCLRSLTASLLKPASSRTLVTAASKPEPSTSKLSTSKALDLLRSQPSHYVIAQLHARLYLLTPNDLLTVPRINNLSIGQKIRLTRIVEVGSRDYTLRAPSLATAWAESGLTKPPRGVSNITVERPVLPNDQVVVHATVVEHTKSKLLKIEKFKKRKRYARSYDWKGKFTKLRINEIVLGQADGSSESESQQGQQGDVRSEDSQEMLHQAGP